MGFVRSVVCVCIHVYSSWNVMAHGDARQGMWKGNCRMQWVASTLHTNSEHALSSITTADAHTSAASSRLNWRPPGCKDEIWFTCACAITFQTQSTSAPISIPTGRLKLWLLPSYYLVTAWLVHSAASEILSSSVNLCEVVSSSSGVPRNLFREEFNKFICGQRTDFYLYLYTLLRKMQFLFCFFFLDVSCGQMLGLIQSQVFPSMGCPITGWLIKFAENLTHWMCWKFNTPVLISH